MGLSSNINVSASVKETYTLLELMDILGSSKKLKDSLLELETATGKADKSLKAITKAETVRKVAVIADTLAKQEIQSECDIRVVKAETAEAKLVVSKNNKKKELAEAEASAKAEQLICEETKASLFAREIAIAQAEVNIAADRKRMKAEHEAAKKEIDKDVKAAEKYRQQALTIKRESDDKVAAMKKLVS